MINFFAVLDDNAALTHAGAPAANGDTVAVKDDVAGDAVPSTNDGVFTSTDLVGTSLESFTLQYVESTGAITLTDQSSGSSYTVTDNSGSPVNVNHMFVSSGNSEYAQWKICGLSRYNISKYPPNKNNNDKNNNNNEQTHRPLSTCFFKKVVYEFRPK